MDIIYDMGCGLDSCISGQGTVARFSGMVMNLWFPKKEEEFIK
jgi:hypothetical protein